MPPNTRSSVSTSCFAVLDAQAHPDDAGQLETTEDGQDQALKSLGPGRDSEHALDRQMSAVAAGSHADSSARSQFPSHRVGDDALQVEGNDAALDGERRRLRVRDPVDLEAGTRSMPSNARAVRACSSSWITSRPIRCRSTSALPSAAMPPTFSSPDDRISSISAGLKCEKPLSGHQHSGAERRVRLVRREGEVVDARCSPSRPCGGRPAAPHPPAGVPRIDARSARSRPGR